MHPALLYSFGALAFIVALMVSIGLHELGHLYFAKKFGARVSQYFVGFGPTVWSKKRGETEYGIKALPLGGFVRIIGMIPPEAPTSPDVAPKLRKSDTGLFTGLISAARKTEAEEVRPEDEHRLFYLLSWPRKLVVMGAGPSVNIILAFLCFLGVFATLGAKTVEVPEGAPTVSYVVACVTGAYGSSVQPDEEGECSVGQESPASLAGLEVGDSIVGVEGESVASWNQLVSTIEASEPDETLDLTVLRAGEEVVLEVKPLQVLTGPNGESSAGYLGVAPRTEAVWTRHGPLYTLSYMGDRTVETFKIFKEIPAKLANVAKALAGVEERDPEGPVSLVGGARFSGEVAAYENGTIEGISFTTSEKVGGFFMLIGIFNLFLGIFNFLPILPLDGGHMAGALWEGIKRAFAKATRRPAPQPVDVAKMLPLAYGFGLMLFFMGLLLITADIFVPLRLLS